MADDIDGEHALAFPHFACKYCRLSLHGHEEMEVAGFESIREVDLNDESELAHVARELIKYRSRANDWMWDQDRKGDRFPDLRTNEGWLEGGGDGDLG
jgi:hypothetical protein